VVPTAIAGSERARNWKRLQFPKVTVQYGQPLRFERVAEPTKEQAQAASEVVFERVKEMHSALQKGGRREAIKASRAARRAARPTAGAG
jgi:1-acyl-sn-glycerol-3-phosphate acyltransferase